MFFCPSGDTLHQGSEGEFVELNKELVDLTLLPQ